MSDHYDEDCAGCGARVSTCKCPGPHEIRYVAACSSCNPSLGPFGPFPPVAPRLVKTAAERLAARYLSRQRAS